MKDSTPQATDAKKCRGHSWMVVTILVEHLKWGMRSFPLGFRLYISKGAMEKLPKEKQCPFMPKTKLLNGIVDSCLKELRGLADNPKRCPSHGDKRKTFRLQLLEKELLLLKVLDLFLNMKTNL